MVPVDCEIELSIDEPASLNPPEEGKFALIEKLRLVKQAKTRKEMKRDRGDCESATDNKSLFKVLKISEMANKKRRDGNDPVYWKDGKNAFDYVGQNYFGEDAIEEVRTLSEKLLKLSEKEKEAWLEREKMPRKKFAIMLGYSGAGYNGMQLNAGVKTIEGELIKAISRSGCVHPLNAYNPAKISFMRSARTDRGVSAVGQICSAKLHCHPDIKERLNAVLPETIRVWNVVPTSKSFHAKNATMSRVYEYMMPTYVFAEPIHKSIWEGEDLFLDSLSKLRESHGFLFAEKLPVLSAEEEQAVLQLQPTIPHRVEELTGEELEKLFSFRMSSFATSKFHEALDLFVGTHNFHNYTVGKSYFEKSSVRTMFSVKASAPFYINPNTYDVEKDGRDGVLQEYISVQLHGASFMLHQIRKMITMAILYTRHSLMPRTIVDSFGPTKLSIPKAPPTGLFLVECRCTDYNARNSDTPIDFGHFAEEIQHFKKRFILSDMFRQDISDKVYSSWLTCIDRSANDLYHFVNKTKGIDDDLQPIHMRSPYREYIYRKRLEKVDKARLALEEVADGAESE